jgi:hypothetical protein
MGDFLHGQRLQQFQALQHCLVPRSQHFTESQHQESLRLVNDFMSHHPPAIHKKLALFFKVINVIAILRFGKSFAKLSLPQRTRIMNFFFNSPIGLLRKGFWGLNTITKLSVFAQTSLYPDIGYEKKDVSHG